MSQKSNTPEPNYLVWQVNALLVTPNRQAFEGTFLECVDRWNLLPGVERARSFIVPSKTVFQKEILRPADLSNLVINPEFLSVPR